MNDKLKSRKFIVWIVSTVFVFLSFIAYIIVKDSEVMSVTKTFAESWGWISAFYIGGNVAQKCFTGEK
jgi:hypothetical protein